MSQKSVNYLCYLLRLWRDDETAPWRASLEAPGASEVKTFASLAAFLKFLESQIGERIQCQQEKKEPK